jgi:hypothetical protein
VVDDGDRIKLTHYDWRMFLLRLGFIGPEFNTARKHLLALKPGDAVIMWGRPGRKKIAKTVLYDILHIGKRNHYHRLTKLRLSRKVTLDHRTQQDNFGLVTYRLESYPT